MKTKLVFLSLILWFTGSSVQLLAQKRLTPEVVGEFGTRIFNHDKDSVFRAVKAVLISHDYLIDIENPAKGIIKTRKKDIGASGSATYGINSSSSQIRSNYRQYNVMVEELEKGKIKVVIVPKIFVGDADLSDEKVWVLKGPAGEIRLWETLFKEISEML